MTRTISHTRSILFALAGFTFWVFSDACFKFLTQTSLPKYEIMMLISLSAIAAMFIITLIRGKIHNLRSQNPYKLFVLGILLLTNMLTLLAAFKFLPLTAVYAVTFMGPMLTAFLAALFLHERLTWQQIVAIIAGFAGVMIAIDIMDVLSAPVEMIGYAAAFVSLALNTGNMLLLRIYGRTETHESMAFYPRFVALAGGVLGCIFVHFEPVEINSIIPVIAAGFFAGTGWLCITIACQKAPASIVAPFRYSQIAAGAILGYILWNDIPTLNLIMGVLIIIMSGIYFALQTHKQSLITIKSEI